MGVGCVVERVVGCCCSYFNLRVHEILQSLHGPHFWQSGHVARCRSAAFPIQHRLRRGIPVVGGPATVAPFGWLSSKVSGALLHPTSCVNNGSIEEHHPQKGAKGTHSIDNGRMGRRGQGSEGGFSEWGEDVAKNEGPLTDASRKF